MRSLQMVGLETVLAIIHHAEQLHMLTTCRCLWLRLRGWFGLGQLQILGNQIALHVACCMCSWLHVIGKCDDKTMSHVAVLHFVRN